LTIRGAFPVFKYSQTNARLWGSDFSLKWHIIRGLESVTKGSFVRATNLLEETPLIFMPPDQLTQQFMYQSEKSRKGITWKATCSIDLVGKQTRFPPDLDILPPPDAYQLVHGSLGLDFLHQGNEVEVSFRITNIFNTRYRSYLNRLRYFADETGRNIEIHIQYLLTKNTNS
jgi:iron complex outermembrane receptor protein